MRNPVWTRWLPLALVIAGVDQATKWLAVEYLVLGGTVEVLPFFNLTLGYNPGAAFSFLGDADGWQRWFLSAVAGGVSVLLIYWLARLRESEPWLSLGLALILAGAVGNFIDRLRLGEVVDFLHLHYGSFHWPLFNVADIAITLGAGLVILLAFRPESRER